MSDENKKALEVEGFAIRIKEKPIAKEVSQAIDIDVGIKEVHISSLKYGNITKEILVTPFLKSYNEVKLSDGTDNKVVAYDTTGCSIIIFIFSIFALLAAISCLKRKHFDLAMVGSIVSIFSFGFFMIGSILCIIAIIIIFKSKEEFNDGKKGKTF